MHKKYDGKLLKDCVTRRIHFKDYKHNTVLLEYALMIFNRFEQLVADIYL